MRRLMLLRHAKTERDSATGKDRDRALDARGLIDAPDIGAWLVAEGYSPERILVSNATRTRQTWDLLPEMLRKAEVEHRADLYLAELPELMASLREAIDNPESLMIIGHNPGLHEMALAYIHDGDPVGRQELNRNLPTSGFVCIDFDVDDWQDVALQRGTLQRFMTPKLMRNEHAS